MRKINNAAASVHDKLLTLARERNEDFNLTLTKYGLERLLYRLSISKHRDVFVLKGALLFELWTEQRYRPTRDADFLATGDNSPDRFAAMFNEICQTEVDVDDGCRFDATTVVAERIKENDDYEGIRVAFVGHLGTARIPIQVDIGFGDAVTPGPQEAEYPAMLDMPRPRLLAYPIETSVAEKFEAMVKLGIANSRMKDIHDLRTLLTDFDFDGITLRDAIANTFERRKTSLPANGEMPLVFTEAFYNDDSKQKQWDSFLKKNRTYVRPEELRSVVLAMRDFLMPVVDSVIASAAFTKKWKAGGPWV